MESTHEVHHHEHNEVRSFYTFIGIIAFAIIVLQPLSMLLVILLQAGMQA